MILWHAVDSWTRRDVRGSSGFAVVTFLAGWAAPLFLFLAGIALPLAGSARQARGATRLEASAGLQRRGWQVFVIAHLFRLQSFLLNPHASWNGLLKPDILNILALAMVYAAFVWGRATTRRGLALGLLLPAVVIAGLLTPLAPTWWWPSLLPPRLEGYIRIVNGNAVFALFPGTAYLLAGAFVGAMGTEHAASLEVFHRRAAIWAALLFTTALTAMRAGLPRAVGFWTTPLAVVVWRTATMTLLLAGAWVLWRRRAPRPGDPLLVFGRTSLFVYWVHVELAYGGISYPLHHAFTLPVSLLACLILTAVMYGLAVAWSRRASRAGVVSPQMSVASARAAWAPRGLDLAVNRLLGHPETARGRSSV